MMRSSSLRPEHAGAGGGQVFVSISNLAVLGKLHGANFAAAALREAARRLCKCSAVTPAEPPMLQAGCFLAISGSGTCASSADEAGISPAIETVMARMSAEPVRFGGTSAMLQLHADWIDVGDACALGAEGFDLAVRATQPVPAPDRPLHDDAWRERCHSAMQVAVRVAEAMQSGHIDVHWEPVVDAFDSPANLYMRARPCVQAGLEPAQGIDEAQITASLESLGLARPFDRVMVHRAIDALCREPQAQLGVSISAQSARCDHWWGSALALLAAHPEVARRLVVELRAGSGMLDLASASALCAALRQRGCKVAFSQVGHGLIAPILAASCADFIKLDASVLRRARDPGPPEALRELLRWCDARRHQVIVDGVDGEEDLALAMTAGARWLQGYYLGGVPTLARRADAELRADVAGPGGRPSHPLREAMRRPTRRPLRPGTRNTRAPLARQLGTAARALAMTALALVRPARCAAPPGGQDEACLRVLQEMPLPGEASAQLSQRAAACVAAAGRRLGGHPHCAAVARQALAAYAHGLARGVCGCGAEPAPTVGDAVLRPVTGVLSEIGHVGLQHGRRIRATQKGIS